MPIASTSAGIGLRSAHHAEIVAARPPIGWVEVHAENYMGGGAAIRVLERVRRDYAVSVHGVGLSIGGSERLSAEHLGRLAALVHRIDPVLVSEHLSWSSFGGTYLNDLLPVPHTEESLNIVAAHVRQVQDALKRRLLVENPSTYLRYSHSEMSEAEFLAELVRLTDCRLLCDVNNIYVSAKNHGSDPFGYLETLPAHAVAEIHLAGHAINHVDGIDIYIDDHGSRVPEPVWTLYEVAVRLFPQAPALIEWDTDVPPLAVLVGEALKANRRRARALWERKHVAAA
jgi:uncharacterized protein